MKKLCLYHIEDNEADRRLLSFALNEQGVPFQLLAAEDGERALELLNEAASGKRARPDLIVLDLNLPKKSGIEVLEDIRGNLRLHTLRVVVLTSSDSPTERRRTEALGIAAYVRKPMDIDGFISLGKHLLLMAGTSE